MLKDCYVTAIGNLIRPSWGPLGPFPNPVGDLLGRPGAIFGNSWAVLGRFDVVVLVMVCVAFCCLAFSETAFRGKTYRKTINTLTCTAANETRVGKRVGHLREQHGAVQGSSRRGSSARTIQSNDRRRCHLVAKEQVGRERNRFNALSV